MPNRKLLLLGGVIVLVDGAMAANQFEAWSYFEHPFFAGLVGLSFATLQVGTLILFATPLPPVTRRLLWAGEAILLTVAGLSNVTMGFIRSKPVFPAEALLPALGFGGDAVRLSVAAAWVSGLSLVVVDLIFWTACGQYVRQMQEQDQQALKDLDDLLRR